MGEQISLTTMKSCVCYFCNIQERL